MKKLFLFILLCSFIASSFFAFNSYIYRQKQGDTVRDNVPYQGKLTGTFACLPHRDTKGPQTLECAFGIKTDSGVYYALDLQQTADQTTISSGKRFSASGTITPVTTLSSDHWQKYAIEGIFTITGPVTLEK